MAGIKKVLERASKLKNKLIKFKSHIVEDEDFRSSIFGKFNILFYGGYGLLFTSWIIDRILVKELGWLSGVVDIALPVGIGLLIPWFILFVLLEVAYMQHLICLARNKEEKSWFKYDDTYIPPELEEKFKEDRERWLI